MGSKILGLGWLVLSLFSRGGQLRHRSLSDCLSAFLPAHCWRAVLAWLAVGTFGFLLSEGFRKGFPDSRTVPALWREAGAGCVVAGGDRVGREEGLLFPREALPLNLAVAGDSSSPRPGAESHKLFPLSHSYYNAVPFVVLQAN